MSNGEPKKCTQPEVSLVGYRKGICAFLPCIQVEHFPCICLAAAFANVVQGLRDALDTIYERYEHRRLIKAIGAIARRQVDDSQVLLDQRRSGLTVNAWIDTVEIRQKRRCTQDLGFRMMADLGMLARRVLV